jgi:hypothetical protein
MDIVPGVDFKGLLNIAIEYLSSFETGPSQEAGTNYLQAKYW